MMKKHTEHSVIRQLKLGHFSLILSISLLLCCCTKTSKKIIIAPEVNGQYAYQKVKEITDIGHHGSGSPGALKVLDIIKQFALENKLKFSIQEWQQKTPKGSITFRNAIIEITGKTDEFVVIGSHYDSKILNSVPDFAGANDSGSSTGLLLAMIKAIKDSEQTPPNSLRFVFFDGEECVIKYTENDGLIGSKYYVNSLVKAKQIKRCKAMVLLDMIGDKDLTITLSQDTNPKLAEAVFTIAERQKVRQHLEWFGGNILDDHVPFQKEGIPSIDLIDFKFGPNNLYWHSKADTMDKISPASLKIAGDLALQLIWNIHTIDF